MQRGPKTGFNKLAVKMAVWAVAILFVCSPCAWAKGKPSGGGGGGTASDIPVTFHVFDAGTASYYVQGDDVQGYFDGTSSEYDNGTDSVTAVLQAGGVNGISNGDGLLNLQSSSRQLRITLSEANAVPDTGADPANSPFGQQGYGYDNSILQISCTRANLSMLNMSEGQKNSCPMSIRLSTGQTKSYYYRLNIGPADPETSQAVQVQCNAVDQTGCSDWYVDPIPTVDAQGNTSPGQAEAHLSTICTTGRCTATDEGDYFLTFHLHVRRP
jgi:hypothetical protein